DRVLTVAGEPQRTYTGVQKILSELKNKTSISVLRYVASDIASPGGVVQFQAPTEVLELTYDPSLGSGAPGIRCSEFVVRLVDPASPEWAAGLRPHDEIVALDGQRFINWALYHHEADSHPGRERVLTFRRGKELLTGTLVYRRETVLGALNHKHVITRFGASNLSAYVAPDPIENDRPIAYGWFKMWDTSMSGLRQALASVTGLLSGKVSTDNLGGPVFIFQASAYAGEAGWITFFTMMAMLSMSLGFINLLPVPMLDGGHLLFFIIEAVKRSPVSLRTRQIASYVGFSFIIVVFVMVTRRDILRAFFPDS
ncbi:MAG: M50 family metallopeptidase, partial [Myxococcota bacterium]|nr:M50 family metallopeptidase [Myxococcota bacterium]